MSKLEELKQLVAEAFSKAEDKQSIENLATINNAITEVSKEYDEVTAKNAELIKSYKDLVQHTSFKDANKPNDIGTVNNAPSFEDIFLNNK